MKTNGKAYLDGCKAAINKIEEIGKINLDKSQNKILKKIVDAEKSIFVLMRKNFYKTGFKNNKSDHENYTLGYNNTLKAIKNYIESNLEDKEIFIEIIKIASDNKQEFVE